MRVLTYLRTRFYTVSRFPGVYVKLEDTIQGFKEIVEGKHDGIPEQAFFNAGTIDDVIAAAEKLAA